jgi:ABC-type phosphate transport system permease subunit
MGLSTPEKYGAKSAATVTERLTSGKRHVGDSFIETGLLASLVSALLILLALILSVLENAWPILSTRFGDFLSSGLDASDASSAGVWQAMR